MAHTYTDGTYTTAAAVSAFISEPAFDGVAEHLVARQDFVVSLASYNPPTIGDASGAWYITGDSDFTDLGGGIIQFTRSFAKVPPRRVEGAAVAWTVPGLAASGDHALLSVNSITATTDATYGTLLSITTAGAHGLVAGDYVALYYPRTTEASAQYWYSIAKVISVSGFAFMVKASEVPAGATATISVVQKTGDGVDTSRPPEDRTVGGYSVYDYFLSADGVAGIEIYEPIKIKTPSGAHVDTYNIGTTPTLLAYSEAMEYAADSARAFSELLAYGRETSGTVHGHPALMVVQPSAVRRWRGNIWERETIYVRAQ
jgi:hypothetical protein